MQSEVGFVTVFIAPLSQFRSLIVLGSLQMQDVNMFLSPQIRLT